MADLLVILQIIYTFVAFTCGIKIWFRNPHYLGNRFFGTGYLIYGVPGVFLSISHFVLDPAFIILSVQLMIIGSFFGIGLLFLGTKVYFKGSRTINPPTVLIVLGGAIIFTLVTIFLPKSVVVLSLDPVNSQPNLIVGGLVVVWHMLWCVLSIHHLIFVRRSAMESPEPGLLKRINLIIAGFYLSIVGLAVYTYGSFGETPWIDIVFFSFNVFDLLCIWWGLGLRESKK